jgi:hypothetical protein
MSVVALGLDLPGHGLEIWGSSLAVGMACAEVIRRASTFMGPGLATSGVCFLALWSLDLVVPQPRWGALLLLISAIGAASVLFGVAPSVPAGVLVLALVAAPVLLLAAVVVLLGQGAE